ncbi:hypothetical protein H310_05316 [Aphanomyces invadans]|uniref:Uncharacterized protein n=1 Tax=Aphanomyces invadans TaxID=157072 RepID=A0A024U8V0_9STRA|nr:hypothetical protein H310_05316 [Aphanomyces invadans]ETW02836.1 hypothetical protein H310_05316 [Aphanomyces invadans]|eukprot:XP_008868220.1 hypothetical protein H310_05316 [Aphanomyces invadans]
MGPIRDRADESDLQLHHLEDSSNQLDENDYEPSSSSAWMGNGSSASSSAASCREPAERIKSWKGQIRDYIKVHGAKYDRSGLVHQLLPITKSLASVLAHTHPLAVQEGFEFITSVATEVGVEAVRPLLEATITHLLHDTKCSQSQCITSVARFASLDIVCIANCFISHVQLNGRMRQMYYHVLRTIVDGKSTLALMEVDQYATLLFLLLECLENFRDRLRQQIAVVMQVALDNDKLNVVWNSQWDLTMKRRCMAAMPDCRRIAKLWARDNYYSSPPQPSRPSTTRPAQDQPPTPYRRPFTAIGKTLDDSDLSSIHFQEEFDGAKDPRQVQNAATVETYEPTRHHCKTSPGAHYVMSPASEAPVPPPHKRHTEAPRSEAAAKRPSPAKVSWGASTTPIPSITTSSAFAPVSSSTRLGMWWRQYYNAGGVMWTLVILSVVFAISGVAHAVLTFSQDFEAWKVRIALSDYHASLDRTERDIQRAMRRLEALTREMADPAGSMAEAWDQDHKLAQAITSAWHSIQHDVISAPSHHDTSSSPSQP